MNDKDIFDFLKGFKAAPNKDELINRYIQGRISSRELDIKMKELGYASDSK